MIRKIFLLLPIVISTIVISANKNDTIAIISLLDSSDNFESQKQDSALLFAFKALNLSSRLKNDKYIAFAHKRIGQLYKLDSKLDSASYYYLHAISILDSLLLANYDSKIAIEFTTALNDEAEIHANIRNMEKAKEYNDRSFEVNKKYNLDQNNINSLITKGKIELINGNNTRAKESWLKGLELASNFKNEDLKARLLNNLGSIYYFEENYKMCLIYYSQAYKIQKKLGNEVEFVPTANNMGLINFMLKNYRNAEKYLLEADSLSEIHDLINSQAIALHYLVQTYLYSGNKKKIKQAFLKFEQVLDKLYNQEKVAKINELEVKFEVEKKNKEIELLEKESKINELEFKQEIAKRNRIIITVALSLIIILLTIAIIFQNYRKKQTLKTQKLNYQKVKSEHNALRAQMNPHFIYNSLNSIQSFISSEKAYEAEKYLAQFAKLMRGILENSRNNLVTLDNEIEILELYLKIEQLRFENRFSYQLIIDKNIEPDFISIPPMLIQPFIENAILHGFKERNNGKIVISFIEKNDFLICEIDDNGIGRKASMNINKKHKSLASEITQERLDVLSHELNKKAFFYIIDKFDENTAKSLGTKIIIQIPIIEA